eukprot:46352_1
MVVVVSDTPEDKIDDKNDIANIWTQCSFWKRGCPSKFHTTFAISAVAAAIFDKFAQTTLTTNCIDYDCDNVHLGQYFGLFKGANRHYIASLPPRQIQIEALQHSRFNPNSNNSIIPSHAVAKTARHENESANNFLHQDLHMSLRLYIEAHKNDERFRGELDIFSGDIHILTCGKEFGFSYWNKSTAAIANKWGQYTNPTVGIDSSVGITLNYIDPVTNKTKDIVTTSIQCQSPANKESVVIFALLTTCRELAMFQTHATRFINYCTYINGGKRPVWKLTMSDGYPFWKVLCLLLNGYDDIEYSKRCFLYIECYCQKPAPSTDEKDEDMEIDEEKQNNEETDEKDAFFKELQRQYCAKPNSLFGICRTHIMCNIEQQFWYNDKELQGQEELQLNLIRFAKCVLSELRKDLWSHQIKHLFFFWNVVTGMQSWPLNKLIDITEFCVTWRELLNMPRVNDGEKYFMKFEYNKQLDAWKADLFETYDIILFLNDATPNLSLPQFMIEQSIICSENELFSEPPNPMKCPTARSYLNKNKLKILPLYSAHILEYPDSDTDAISENTYWQLKHNNVNGNNEKKRADAFVFQFCKNQQAKIDRMLFENNIKLTKQIQQQIVKDKVKLIHLTKEEEKLHELFAEYVPAVIGYYHRQSIVDDFDNYVTEQNRRIKIELNVQQITKLNNEGNLPKSALWRDEMKIFFKHRINSKLQQKQHELAEYRKKK